MITHTEELPAHRSNTHFWGNRRTKVGSAAAALLLAILVTVLVAGGRGGSGPLWLPFANKVGWLPFRDAISWLQFGHGSKPSTSPSPDVDSRPVALTFPSPSPSPTPSPEASAVPSPTPIPTATPTKTPEPHPTSTPTPTPTVEPTPTPTPKPEPTPTPAPTPSPSPTATPSPWPSPGTVLFRDDFEADPLGPVAKNWTLSPATGAWAVVADGSHVLSLPGTGLPTATAGGQNWTDYKVSADVKTSPTNGHAHLIARYESDQYYYACGLDHPGTLFLGKVYGGTWYTFKTATYVYTQLSWYRIDFSVQGNSLTCSVTDPTTGLSATVTDTLSYFPAGRIGATGEYAEFDNFLVTALP